MDKVALITGISGQDGCYLSKLLIENKYKVYGLTRNNNNVNLAGLQYLQISEQINIIECDLLDISQVIKVLKTIAPNVIYNLAAQSSVSLSFQQPIGTFSFNTLSVFNLLEAIRLVDSTIKFYQASSSEMFGKINKLPITEDSEFHPLSPYAISKAAAHWTCVNYRESYGMFICCGILFNHESYLRSNHFFIKKVITTAIEIKNGEKRLLEVGNILIKRDFGYAPEYVKAMYSMMNLKSPKNYIICSGQSVSLKAIIEYVFEKVGLNSSRYRVSEALYRPADIDDIYGDSGKVKQELGWDYNLSIENVLDKLIEEELRNRTNRND